MRITVAVLLLAVHLLCGTANQVLAQVADTAITELDLTRAFPALHPLPNGRWIGLDRGEVTDRLLLYDSLFREQAQTQWQGLHPLDITALPSPWGDSIALLLARPSGATLLFKVQTGNRPAPEPIWQKSGAGFHRIVGVQRSPGSFIPEAIIAGDSGLAAIRLDGTPRFIRPTKVLAALPSLEVQTELILVERRGASTSVSWVDMLTGNTVADRRLDSEGDILAAIGKNAREQMELVVVTSNPPTLYSISKKSRGFQERIPLLSFPSGLVPLQNGNGYALIYQEFPTPRVEIVSNGRIEHSSLYYPTNQIFSHIYTNDAFVLLVAPDTTVVYNKNLEFLCTVNLPGGPNPHLTPLANHENTYLFRSDKGSRLVVIHQQSLLWLKQNLWWLIGILLGLVSASIGIYLYRRYRFIRAVYANLVQAPETDGVVVTTERGRLLLINQSARRLLGMTGPVPLGRHISSYLATDELRPILDSVRKLLATTDPFESELIRSIDGNRRTLRLQGRVMSGRYGGNSGYILLIEDITATLERDRLVNWASVAHHIAHEMKTPLGTVRTSAEILRQILLDYEEPQKVIPALQRILRQSVRLREIVDDLLTVARTEELKRVDADVSLILSSLIDDFSEYVPSTIALRFERHGEDFRASVDTDQLIIAVRNLLDNARQAIGERESGEIHLTLYDEEENLKIVVRDNGVGMARSTLDRLFQPYYTEKEGGSGIGTVIVKRVFEAHGGNVEVDSELGLGTVFTLTLPKTEEEET